MSNIIEICGWLGSACYLLYTIPQAFDALKKGKTEDISSGMVLLLFFGSIFSLTYIMPNTSSPLFYNFFISLITTTIILKYHFSPRKE